MNQPASPARKKPPIKHTIIGFSLIGLMVAWIWGAGSPLITESAITSLVQKVNSRLTENKTGTLTYRAIETHGFGLDRTAVIYEPKLEVVQADGSKSILTTQAISARIDPQDSETILVSIGDAIHIAQSIPKNPEENKLDTPAEAAKEVQEELMTVIFSAPMEYRLKHETVQGFGVYSHQLLLPAQVTLQEPIGAMDPENAAKTPDRVEITFQSPAAMSGKTYAQSETQEFTMQAGGVQIRSGGSNLGIDSLEISSKRDRKPQENEQSSVQFSLKGVDVKYLGKLLIEGAMQEELNQAEKLTNFTISQLKIEGEKFAASAQGALHAPEKPGDMFGNVNVQLKNPLYVLQQLPLTQQDQSVAVVALQQISGLPMEAMDEVPFEVKREQPTEETPLPTLFVGKAPLEQLMQLTHSGDALPPDDSSVSPDTTVLPDPVTPASRSPHENARQKNQKNK